MTVVTGLLTGSFVIAAVVERGLTGSVVTAVEGVVDGVGGNGGSVNNTLKHTHK